MNFNRIKSVYKKIPSTYLKPLSFVPFSVFCGSNYRNTFSSLEETSALSEQNVERYVNSLLISYLNESIHYSPFYRDFAKSKGISKVVDIDQLFQFPVLCKEQVQQDLSWFVDKRFRNKSYSVTTGGTTGKQTKILMSNECYAIEWAFIAHFLKTQDIDIDSKRLCLRGVSGIPENDLIGYNYLYKEMLISPFKCSFNAVNANIDSINKFNAKWVHGYPSSVSELAKIIDSMDVKFNKLDSALLVSEKLYPEQEKIILNVLARRIVTFYGMTERVIFAPKENGVYIPSPFYGFTEEIDGELIGTGYINRATRLIRYRTGDEAEVVKNSFGRVTQITDVVGRWGKEYLIGKNNSKISMTSLNVHSEHFNSVDRYQFYQKEKGTCELLLKVNNQYVSGYDKVIVGLFKDKVGNELEIIPRIVNDIPLTSRGKHVFIISNV